ncbi:MAG: radical SAM protein [Candidatus Deferrimicrobiaceae bacterium]
MDVASLRKRHARAVRTLERCRLCPRGCGVNRRNGETGFCGAGISLRVAAVSVHHGEEPPISGTRGSGTVFFSHCNMKCIFCQNYPISQLGVGERMSTEELGERLLGLERKGTHNVNFVTPTPHVPQLIGAVAAAREKGFALPVVYNSNGYDSPEALALLERVVDIYLPDVKYVSPRLAEDVSATPDYPAHNAAAVSEMFRQVGPLSPGEDGIARKGVLLRHLVIPGKGDETEKVLARLRETYGPQVPLSLMGQYFPAYQAASVPGLNRRLASDEYERAVETARRLGLDNVFLQEI